MTTTSTLRQPATGPRRPPRVGTREEPLPIWRRPLPRTRTGAPPLTVEQIAAAAIDIADRQSLAAVSVKRVAAKVGVPAVRLERYLPCREDLFDVMLDAAYSEVELPDPRYAASWQGELTALAYALRDVTARHDWVSTLLASRAPYGPNGLAFTERLLAAFTPLGLEPDTLMPAANTVLAFVIGSARLHATGEAADAARHDSIARYLAEQATEPDYPTLGAVLPSAGGLTAADAFRTGLDLLLAGLTSTAGRSPTR